MGRLGRRRNELLGDLKVTRRCWKLKEESLALQSRELCFGSGYEPVVRQTVEMILVYTKCFKKGY